LKQELFSGTTWSRSVFERAFTEPHISQMHGMGCPLLMVALKLIPIFPFTSFSILPELLPTRRAEPEHDLLQLVHRIALRQFLDRFL